MKSYYFGIAAEYIAAFFYFIRFYKILGHRVKTFQGEIDLVAVKGKTIIFIEVKARMNYIDDILCKNRQQTRIRNAAEIFLQKHKKFQTYNVRFDLCVVRPYKWPKVIENAW